jgi:exopolysaccharide biosynthesis operon protein EpsL
MTCRHRLRDYLRLSAFLTGGLLLMASATARALEGDTLRPFLDLSMGSDSNLFRFSNDAQARASPLGEPIQSITYQRYGAGVDLDWKQGRQQLTGRVSANQTSYSRYANLLDFTGQDLKGGWNWQLGNRWSGNLSTSRNRIQSPFNDGTVTSNVSTTDTLAFQADYWFHSDWRARFRLGQNDLKYSATARQVNNSKRKSTTFGLYRQGGAVDQLGMELTEIRGEYPNRVATATLDNRSDEQAMRLLGNWTVTGKTRLTGSIGYVQRTQPNVKNHDFTGLEWRLSGTWVPTGKTLFEASYTHDLRESDDFSVNYVEADGFNLAVSWLLWPKTRLIGQGSYDVIKYEGSPREDEVLSATLSANYEIWRGGDLAFGLQHSQRSSTTALLEYDSTMLFASANLKF